MYHLLKGPILRLNVPSDEHSHLIGKKGQSHKQLQSSSKTLIHFPEIKGQTKQSPSGKQNKESFPPQAEDEVLITPTELELKREPCTAQLEDRLIQVFTASRQNIRKNQLLIFKLNLSDTPQDLLPLQRELDRIASIAAFESIIITLEKRSTLIVRGIMDKAAKLVFITNLIRETIVGKFGIKVTKLYSSMRIPSIHWNDLIQIAAAGVIKDYKMIGLDSIPPAGLLNFFLSTIGITVEFQNNALITVTGDDPTKILEVRVRLINALPISLLIASNSVMHNLMDSDSIKYLEEFYSVKIDTNFGQFFGNSRALFGDLAAKRFFIGQKVALQTNEENFDALFEVKWLLSQPNLSQLLARWSEIRMMWPNESASLPIYLQSPKYFGQMESRYRVSKPISSPSPLQPLDLPSPTSSLSKSLRPESSNVRPLFPSAKVPPPSTNNLLNSTPTGSKTSLSPSTPFFNRCSVWSCEDDPLFTPESSDNKPSLMCESLRRDLIEPNVNRSHSPFEIRNALTSTWSNSSVFESNRFDLFGNGSSSDICRLQQEN